MSKLHKYTIWNNKLKQDKNKKQKKQKQKQTKSALFCSLLFILVYVMYTSIVIGRGL